MITLTPEQFGRLLGKFDELIAEVRAQRPPRTAMRFLGRFNGLPTLPAAGTRILDEDPARRGLLFYNAGTGAVRVRSDATEITTADWPIPAGATFGPGQAPVAPQDALWAAMAAGGDLYVYALVEVGP